MARRRGVPTADVLVEWAEIAPAVEKLLTEVRVWPGFLDVLAHEHDIPPTTAIAAVGSSAGHMCFATKAGRPLAAGAGPDFDSCAVVEHPSILTGKRRTDGHGSNQLPSLCDTDSRSQASA